MFDHTTQHRTRLRERSKKKKECAVERLRYESAKPGDLTKLIDAIDRASEKLEGKEYENADKRRERRWHKAEVIGIWIVGVVTIVVSGFYSHHQRDVMNDQLDEMRSEQRAWIKMGAFPQGLKFDPVTGNASLSYGLEVENVGRSVALQARIEARAILLGQDENPLLVLIPRQERFCADAIANKATENMDRLGEGVTLFPNEKYPFEGGLSFGGNTAFESKDIIGSATKIEQHPQEFFVIYLIGCVTYKLALTDKRHQTGVIYKVARTDGSDRSFPLLLKIGDDIAPPDLKFFPWYFGHGKID